MDAGRIVIFFPGNLEICGTMAQREKRFQNTPQRRDVRRKEFVNLVLVNRSYDKRRS
jgi:hypothetical protein